MAERKIRGLKDSKIARLEGELQAKIDQLGQRNAELSHQLDTNAMLKNQCKALEHQVDNQRTQAIDMGSRIGVLESDRDRLTTAVEVLARRIVSPQAEKDRSRAGWRSFTNAISPRDDRSEAPRS